jgi:hypothetical protein
MRVFRMMAMAWGEVPVRKVEAVLSEGRVAGGAFFDGAPVSAQDLLPATGRTGQDGDTGRVFLDDQRRRNRDHLQGPCPTCSTHDDSGVSIPKPPKRNYAVISQT